MSPQDGIAQFALPENAPRRQLDRHQNRRALPVFWVASGRPAFSGGTHADYAGLPETQPLRLQQIFVARRGKRTIEPQFRHQPARIKGFEQRLRLGDAGIDQQIVEDRARPDARRR